jgi:hypothetical protein
MAELQHARTRSICPAAPHPERRPVVHQTPQPQPPPPPPQQQDAQYRYQPSGVQEHQKMGVKPGHRRARNPGPSPEILIARQEAERWFELQRWQQMLRCLRRWRARVAELCQRRHVREAKEFVRSQGRAQAAQKAKPSKPAHRRVDQRVFDQRATVRVPRHGPRRAPATSKAQKAREAEAELRQLRNGDISSLLSEGSSLWEASDYSGFGFARGRAIGRAPCTSGRCNSGGRAASRYSDSNTGAENDPSAIWSDASSSDTPHSFATTDASDASNSTESIQTSAVESAWEEDFHARRGEVGQDYHEQSILSEASARTLVHQPAAMPTTRSGFRMRKTGIPTISVVKKEQHRRPECAVPRQTSISPPPSPDTLARLKSALRERHLALIFRCFTFWLDWVEAVSPSRTAQMATAEQAVAIDAQVGCSFGAHDDSAISAVVSSVSDPHGQDSSGCNSIQRRMAVEQPPLLGHGLAVEEDIDESIEIEETDSPTTNDRRSPTNTRTSWDSATLGDELKEKVRNLLAVQTSIEWNRVFEQASGFASPQESSRETSWPWQAETQPSEAYDQTSVAGARAATGSAVDQLLSESMTWDADCPEHASAMATLISPRDRTVQRDTASDNSTGAVSPGRPRQARSNDASWPWQAETQPSEAYDQTSVAGARAATGSAMQSIPQRTEVERFRKSQAEAIVHTELRTSGELDQAVAAVSQQISDLGQTLGQTLDPTPTSTVVDSVQQSRTQVPVVHAWCEQAADNPKQSSRTTGIEERRLEVKALHLPVASSIAVDTVLQRRLSPTASPRSPRGYASRPRLTPPILLPTVAAALRKLADTANAELVQAKKVGAETNVTWPAPLLDVDGARAQPEVFVPRESAGDRGATSLDAWASTTTAGAEAADNYVDWQRSDQGPFAAIPPDALLHVLQFLGERDILQGTALVCRAWNAISLDLSLWDDVEQPRSYYRGVKIDLRNHFLGSAGAKRGERSGTGGLRREVLQLRMQRRVRRIPELALLLQSTS